MMKLRVTDLEKAAVLFEVPISVGMEIERWRPTSFRIDVIETDEPPQNEDQSQ